MSASINRILIVTGSIVIALIRACLAAVMMFVTLACFLLFMASMLAYAYDIESLRPVISWMPAEWVERCPFAHGMFYVFGACLASFLTSLLISDQ